MKLSDYIGRYWASAEVMYAVITAMTFTNTLRGRVAIFGMPFQTVVFSALFCCAAWIGFGTAVIGIIIAIIAVGMVRETDSRTFSQLAEGSAVLRCNL
jgi:hypothetical protein